MGRWLNCIVCFDRLFSFDDEETLLDYVDVGFHSAICTVCLNTLNAKGVHRKGFKTLGDKS